MAEETTVTADQSISLREIGVTLGFGIGVCVSAIIGFGFAVRSQSTNIAPRCEARPRNVIYNPDRSVESQNRGNAFLGWIPWVLNLSYATMLKGIPGTGTRDDGLSGSLLRVNMEDIVLLRFHSFGLRVSIIGTLLFCACVLPVCMTSECYGHTDNNACAGYNMTKYASLTVANIPSVRVANAAEDVVEVGNVNIRLCAIVFSSWLLIWYTCRQLKQEWIEILAMRRVYYLEFDHWAGRREELKNTGILNSPQNRPSNDDAIDRRAHMREISGSRKQKVDPDDHLTFRDPWIPHPEQRDTTSNIALYTVLVGGLPSIPSQVLAARDIENVLGASERQHIDWQLSVTSAFFDHCVPNQLGFSSSVAAVTILPGSSELSSAWKKWYAAAAKLRRLRFIRREIAERRHYEIDEEEVEGETEAKSELEKRKPGRRWSTRQFYTRESTRKKLNREILGTATDDQVEKLLMGTLKFGPEQTAVYSRELAQSAAPCCPNGCCEFKILKARIDELEEMEKCAIEDLNAANLALQAAQQRVTEDAGHTSTKGFSGSGTEPGTGDAKPRDPTKNVRKILKSTLDQTPKLDYGVLTSHFKTPTKADGAEKKSDDENGKDFDLENVLLERERTTKNKRSSMKESTIGSLPDSCLPKPCSEIDTGGIPSDSMEGTNRQTKKEIDNPFQSVPSAQLGAFLDELEQSDEDEAKDTVDPLSMNASKRTASPLPSNLKMEHSFREGPLLPAQYVTEFDTSGAAMGMRRRKGQANDPWALVQEVVNSSESMSNRGKLTGVASGLWILPSPTAILNWIKDLWIWTFTKSNDVVDNLARDLARDSTFAVVTFTSRQAAVAARHCLADGRGSNRWTTVEDIPVPPLADAAACDLLSCRGCCRPVTLSTNDNQKLWRHYMSICLLATIYTLYTVPLGFCANFFSSDSLEQIFPPLEELKDDYSFVNAESLAGLILSGIWTIFFSLCPFLFKAIANFGSNAANVVAAEISAMRYFWWFMVVSAFSSTSLSTVVIEAYKNREIDIGNRAQDVLVEMANSIPTIFSATWINWIIFKTFITLPIHYMLQFNSFFFDLTRMGCCARLVRGGGAGGPMPFRIYVDSGVVLLCLFSLGPAAPLVAPFAFVYFFVATPILRRNVIFMHRANFDAGGVRWPFLSDMVVSSLLVGQILLTTILGLKQAVWPALLAAAPLLPTMFFRKKLRKQFLPAFNDCALLQTALLDGWDTSQSTSMEGREEFRQFLVDAHKAAYVPVCIAGTQQENDILTAEPAVVVPIEGEELNQRVGGTRRHSSEESIQISSFSAGAADSISSSVVSSVHQQFGASFRRASINTSSGRRGFQSLRHIDMNDDGSVNVRMPAYLAIPKEDSYENEVNSLPSD